MKIEIEIDSSELADLVKEKMAARIVSELMSERHTYDKNVYRRIMQEATRDVIYKDKVNIVDRVVEQASREVRNKAFRQMLDSDK